MLHQLERVKTYNDAFTALSAPKDTICKVIPGRYVRKAMGESDIVVFDSAGFTVQVAVQTRSGFEYLDAYFDTEQEALDARQAVVDLCMVKAHGK